MKNIVKALISIMVGMEVVLANVAWSHAIDACMDDKDADTRLAYKVVATYASATAIVAGARLLLKRITK